MPRVRKPTSVLQFTGAFAKNPQRAESRKHEPKPTGGIGEPPSRLTDDQKKIWFELVGESLPGVLSNADRQILELTVRAVEMIRVVYDPKVAAQLNQYLQQLGMTPAARSKVQAAKDEAKDEDNLGDI